MPKISIIMPVYNGAKYLEKSLESVSRQTFNDLEVICVDDGSTDNSLEVLDELKAKYDFIKVISQENQGSGKALTQAFKMPEENILHFLMPMTSMLTQMPLMRCMALQRKTMRMLYQQI